VIPVSLTKTVDAKKAKTGDEVIATVTTDLKTDSGQILVPKDTKVVGHVTQAQAHSKEQKESQVGIEFDHAVMKSGGEMQMPMSIQAVIGQQNQAVQNGGGGGAATVRKLAEVGRCQAAQGEAAWAEEGPHQALQFLHPGAPEICRMTFRQTPSLRSRIKLQV
jgi:hypothetical protein